MELILECRLEAVHNMLDLRIFQCVLGILQNEIYNEKGEALG